MIILDKGTRYILNKISENGGKGYIVGGCVRDYMLNRKCQDVDITTNLLPEKIVEIFTPTNGVFKTGLKHGTVTVLVDKVPYEITTFRADGEYLDNRRPKDVVFVNDVKEDLLRRDFTINSLAYNEEEGLVDISGGLFDLNNKIIRAVGNADERFNEDALRILRAIRFSSELGFTIEEKTKQSIIKNKGLLKNISAERIYVELIKLLMGDNVKDVLLNFKEVIFEIIPELIPEDGFDQRSKFHIYDVYRHSVEAISIAEKNKVVRLTLLLHDIGKPISCTQDEDGTRHFRTHQEEGVIIAKPILERLKVDNNTKKEVLDLIYNHDRFKDPSRENIKWFLNKYGLDFLKLITLVRYADIKAHSDYLLEERIALADKCLNTGIDIVNNNECYLIKDLKINGDDLIELGFKSKEIGDILNKLLEEVIKDNNLNEKDKLINIINKWKS